MEKGKPLDPNKVQEIKNNTIPAEIFDAVNQLIVENWDGSEAIIKQNAIINKYFELAKIDHDSRNIMRRKLFDKHLLDIEKSYREMGWSVEYEKPSYGDNDFEAYFKFKK